jgi:hypothetical protein
MILPFIIFSLLPLGTHCWYGGNVVVTLMEGRNLPQLDNFGGASGRTDAFVKVTIAFSHVFMTKYFTIVSFLASNIVSLGPLKKNLRF